MLLVTTSVTGTANSGNAGAVVVTIGGLSLAGLDAGNYTLAPVTLGITITPVALTLTVRDARRTTGANNPTFSVTSSGFVGGDGIDDLSGALTYTCAATANSPVGVYASVSVG